MGRWAWGLLWGLKGGWKETGICQLQWTASGLSQVIMTEREARLSGGRPAEVSTLHISPSSATHGGEETILDTGLAALSCCTQPCDSTHHEQIVITEKEVGLSGGGHMETLTRAHTVCSGVPGLRCSTSTCSSLTWLAPLPSTSSRTSFLIDTSVIFPPGPRGQDLTEGSGRDRRLI